MKKINLLFTICLLVSCCKPHTARVTHSTDVCTIYDISDTFELKLLADPILSLYDFEDDNNQEARFRLTLITDKQLNPTEDICIADGETTEQSNTNDDITYREELIYSFYDAVRNVCRDFPKEYMRGCTSLSHSECFATIASELQRLAHSAAAQRKLIVFGDVQENEDQFSCYTPEGQRLLQTNPDKVISLLQKRAPLPDNLIGINVYFAYLPITRKDDERFLKMVSLYKQMLHSRGARVIIQTTNKYYEP